MDFGQENQQPQNQPQPQGNEPQQQPQQQPPAPAPTIDNLIIDNPEFQQPQGQPQQQPQQQPAPQQQPQGGEQQPQGQPQQQPQQQPQGNEPPQVDDPYVAQGGVRTVRANFDKWLDEKYPIQGKLDINSVDKKDPQALAQFFGDMQDRTQSDIRNEQMRDNARAEFERQLFEPVYTAYPKLRQDPVTDQLVRMLYRGASAENPNISPIAVVSAFSNFTRQLYAAAVKSAQANIQQIPTPPAGSQGRAHAKTLNMDVVDKMAGGGVDDVAKMVAAMQGQGVGGL